MPAPFRTRYDTAMDVDSTFKLTGKDIGEEVGGGSISRIHLKTSQVSPRSSNESPETEHEHGQISDRSIDLSKYSKAKMKAIREILLTDSPNSKAVLQQQKYKTQRNSPRL